MGFAEDHGIPMRLHACEGLHEWELIKDKGGESTLAYFDIIGLLSPHLLIPHGIVARDREIKLLADHGISLIHTPIAEINFGTATTNGAKALGREDIGRLSSGTRADIIVIDLDDLSVGPHQDPIRPLLMNCVGNNVPHTIINGRMLMQDRRLLEIDERELMQKAQEVYDKFIHLYTVYDTGSKVLYSRSSTGGGMGEIAYV
jgi:cytosine/adenosine deaminase-related metal-dependent hydrolase